MTLRDHTILGGLASAALYPLMGFNALWFFCAAVLIDIDHYLDFIYHNKLKDLSLKSMFLYHETLAKWWASPEFMNMEVFHTAETLAVVFVLALVFRSGALRAVFFGLVFHMGLDVFFLLRHGIVRKRVHSIAGYFLKKRSMAREGLDPANLYERAAGIVAANRAGKGLLKRPIDVRGK